MTTSEVTETVRDMVIRYAQKFEGPNDIAAAIIEEVTRTPEVLRACLIEVLPEYCGKTLREQRNRGVSTGVTPPDDPPSDHAPSNPARSAKSDSIRAWHKNFLALQLHVATEWKRMGDCTKEDLMFGAAERRKQAEKTLYRAAELESLAVALDMHGKRTVRDLPESVVHSVLESVR